MTRITCPICPQNCRLEEGQAGFCRARSNQNGKIRDDNYGQATALSLDPIEKKPLYHFHPGSYILSIGSFGCNLRCPFCQNHGISMDCDNDSASVYTSPEELLEKSSSLVDRGNIGAAFTYNEPLIGYEYVYDSAKLLQANGLKTVLVTNGYINEAPLLELLPYIDAMNIDLKGFSEDFYRRLSGHLEPVKKSIALAQSRCHVEVTTLIVPGWNDTAEEMIKLSRWLADLNNEIPLHISRFFPQYKLKDRPATPVETVYGLAKLARKYLKYVYEGNC